MAAQQTPPELPPAAQLYTITKLAKALGWGAGRTPEQRLRRYLARREKLLNVELLIEVGTPARSVFRVSLAALREHCGELFDARSEAEVLLRERLEQIEERVVRLGKNDERIADTLRTLGSQLTPVGAAPTLPHRVARIQPLPRRS